MIEQLLHILKEIKLFFNSSLKSKNVTLPYFILGVITLIVFIGSIKLFIELTDVLKSETLANYDTAITAFAARQRSPFLTDYFVFITNVGDATGYLIVFISCAIIFYFVFKSWKYIIQLITVLVLALSSNLILKQIINRARPVVEHLVTVETLSYPSGHAMMAMAFYGILIYLLWQFPWNKLLKYFLTIILVTLILSIGFSRIYLGVHFPSDIAGGYIAGFIWVIFCIIIFNLIRIFRRDPAT
jgi:undecaprenyl-diphosphatase